MTYDGQSPITGAGIATPAAIDAWFAHKGPGYTAYAPDGLYKPAPAIGNSIVVYAGVMRLNSDLVAAQCLHESAAWQSRIAREKNNPAGLGAENDDPEGKAIAFLTPDMGIRAQAAHLADYAIGRGDWTKYDPRADAMRPEWFGIAKSLNGLDGRWAFPGVGYGASIAALANDLVAFAQTGGPVPAQIPGFQWHPADSQHFTKGRTQRIIGGAQHYSAGVNSLSYLSTDASTNVSATFLVKRNATLADRGWQLVRIEDTSHTTGGVVNPYTVAMEYEHMADQDIPDGDYEVLSQTWVDIAKYVADHELGAVPLDRQHIKGHKEWVGDDRVCPDGISVDRVVNRAAAIALGVTPTADAIILPDNPHGAIPIVLGFRAYVITQATTKYAGDLNASILSEFGWPETPEYVGKDGLTYQVFERRVLQYTPGNQPPWDIVPLRREDQAPEAA